MNLPSSYYYYAKYRLVELPVWLGVPLIGIFYTEGLFFSWEFLLFLFGTFFFMMHILLFNDWGGLVKNPLEAHRYTQDSQFLGIKKYLLYGAVSNFILSVIFFGFIKVPLIILPLLGGFFSFLYSSPSIHWKENFALSKWLHLCGGEIKFLMGFFVFSTDIFRGILIGLFYSCIFVAGNLIHECIDLEADRRGQLKTAAVKFGSKPLIKISWLLFLCAHGYLMSLAAWNVVSWGDCAIFTLPLLVHARYMVKNWMGKFEVKEFVKYRKEYRIWYALSASVFILKQLLLNW